MGGQQRLGCAQAFPSELKLEGARVCLTGAGTLALVTLQPAAVPGVTRQAKPLSLEIPPPWPQLLTIKVKINSPAEYLLGQHFHFFLSADATEIQESLLF